MVDYSTTNRPFCICYADGDGDTLSHSRQAQCSDSIQKRSANTVNHFTRICLRAVPILVLSVILVADGDWQDRCRRRGESRRGASGPHPHCSDAISSTLRAATFGIHLCACLFQNSPTPTRRCVRSWLPRALQWWALCGLRQAAGTWRTQAPALLQVRARMGFLRLIKCGSVWTLRPSTVSGFE